VIYLSLYVTSFNLWFITRTSHCHLYFSEHKPCYRAFFGLAFSGVTCSSSVSHIYIRNHYQFIGCHTIIDKKNAKKGKNHQYKRKNRRVATPLISLRRIVLLFPATYTYQMALLYNHLLLLHERSFRYPGLLKP